MSDKKIPTFEDVEVIRANTKVTADTIVGMTAANAVTTFPQTKIRVMKEDGEPRMGTMDFRVDRINVEVKDGVITSVISLS